MSWLGDLFSPPAAQVQAPQGWALPPSAMTEVAGKALGGINNLGGYNQYAQTLPMAQQTTMGLYNNPFGQDWLSGAQTAGGMGMQGAQNIFGQGGNLFGGANQIMNTAFDPQNDLYERTRHNVEQQTRSGQASRGVLNTPYGAGLENDATRNFNIDWQNAQLGRQAQGLGSAGQANTIGAGLQGAAPGMFNTASAMPYNAFQGIGQNQLGALGQLGQFGQAGSTQAQDPIRQYLALLGVGNQANQTQNQNFQNQLQQSNLANQQSGQMWGGLGQLAGNLLPFLFL